MTQDETTELEPFQHKAANFEPAKLDVITEEVTRPNLGQIGEALKKTEKTELGLDDQQTSAVDDKTSDITTAEAKLTLSPKLDPATIVQDTENAGEQMSIPKPQLLSEVAPDDRPMEASFTGLVRKGDTLEGHTLISPMMSMLRVKASDFTIRSEDFT